MPKSDPAMSKAFDLITRGASVQDAADQCQVNYRSLRARCRRSGVSFNCAKSSDGLDEIARADVALFVKNHRMTKAEAVRVARDDQAIRERRAKASGSVSNASL